MAATAPLLALRATSPVPGESVFNKGGLRADASIGPLHGTVRVNVGGGVLDAPPPRMAARSPFFHTLNLPQKGTPMDTTGKLKLGFAALMILSGIGVAMYPVVSNAVAQRHASAVIDSYDDTVQSMDTEKLDAAKEAARSYNEQLSNAVGRDAAGEAADTGTSYVDLMDVGESLGYIKIPKIDVNLPIYEGTSDEVLLKGIGHLEGSSYPLGGDSTHSVLTGHRGLAEAVLFTDLDKMQEGDKFYLHVMDEVLAYQVDQVKVVEPEHTEDLEIIPGGDYCTLVTCTPYAINTHRMLVRGVRVPYNGEDEDADTPQAVQYQALNTGNIVKRVVDAWPWISVTGSIIIGGEALLLLLLLHRCKKREEED